LAFLTQNKAKLCKILIKTLVFEKKANFFAENWQKSQKIVIKTLTPDCANFRLLGDCLVWEVFWKILKVDGMFVLLLFQGKNYVLIFSKIGLGEDFTNSSGHPARSPI
jgi:hypothetical protein